MKRRLDPVEPKIALRGQAPADTGGYWDRKARKFGYASVAPLVADLCVAYDDGRIARARGQPCRQLAFRGDHANVWVDGWHGRKKPAA